MPERLLWPLRLLSVKVLVDDVRLGTHSRNVRKGDSKNTRSHARAGRSLAVKAQEREPES